MRIVEYQIIKTWSHNDRPVAGDWLQWTDYQLELARTEAQLRRTNEPDWGLTRLMSYRVVERLQINEYTTILEVAVRP